MTFFFQFVELNALIVELNVLNYLNYPLYCSFMDPSRSFYTVTVLPQALTDH
jgi:hypothetical protein